MPVAYIKAMLQYVRNVYAHYEDECSIIQSQDHLSVNLLIYSALHYYWHPLLLPKMSKKG